MYQGPDDELILEGLDASCNQRQANTSENPSTPRYNARTYPDVLQLIVTPQGDLNKTDTLARFRHSGRVQTLALMFWRPHTTDMFAHQLEQLGGLYHDVRLT